MKNIFIVIFILSISFSCKKSDSNTIDGNERFELVPELDNEERLRYEVIEALKKDTCKFLNPDISINELFIKDYESSDKIIGIDNIIDLNEKSDKTNSNFKVLNIDTFESEKGIKLGVSKEFVKTKLGNCNKEILHSDSYIELLYRIEQPNDSEMKLLEKYNMPVYYATYKFLNNKLIEFEFGFEYP